MAEELTWPGVTAKVGSLGFSEEDQGYIRSRLLATSSEMWARYLDGSDAIVRGQLLTLLPAGSRTAGAAAAGAAGLVAAGLSAEGAPGGGAGTSQAEGGSDPDVPTTLEAMFNSLVNQTLET